MMGVSLDFVIIWNCSKAVEFTYYDVYDQNGIEKYVKNAKTNDIRCLLI